MSTVVAIVKSIVGQVIAVSPEGIKRVLIEGDRLFAGEEVLTGPGGAVTLELADGRMLDLGRDSQWSADTPASSADLGQVTAQAAPSVEELQQAIAAGADPTTDLEAPAAGPTAAGGGSVGGGHSFVLLEETAGVVDPTIGFPTDPLNFAAALNTQQVGGLNANNATTTSTVPVATGLTLTATPSISEAGGVIVYTANVGQAPQSDLTVTLSNGAVVVIQAGQTSGSVNVNIPANDTPYIDGGQISTTITSTSGGTGLIVTPSDTPAVTQITDTIDTTTATLTATPSVTEGGVITYTVSLTNPAQTPVTVTLSNGQTITVEAGKSSGSIDFQTPPNDVYVNGSTVNTTITSATGGNFENLVTNPTPAQTVVSDSIDTVTVNIASNGNVTEAQQPTFTVSVSQQLDRDLTVTLSNGDKVVIAAGQTQATYSLPAQGDDVFKDPGSVTVGVTDASVPGKTFENLQLGGAATVQITDTVSEVVATLTADKATVAEGGQVTYTVTLTNAQGLDVTGHQGLTFTLTDGTKVTIPAGSASASATIQAADDVYVGGQPSIVNKLESVTGADNFEKLTLGDNSITTTVTDEPGTGTPGAGNEGDKVSVTIVSNGDVNEAQQPSFTVKVSQVLDRPLTVTLSNGDKVTIAAGQTEVEYKAPAQGEDVFKDAGSLTVGITDASVAGKTFEN
ncbi:retention module-containing protein, partial [Pseudomonas sp. RAC1]|uniref:retention module-containing protein n=1 Tax=Pseudomonas sp. RAC1 TaxID=3064900 RepID=UPI00271C41AA